jgi:hypothetical protein
MKNYDNDSEGRGCAGWVLIALVIALFIIQLKLIVDLQGRVAIIEHQIELLERR